MLASRFVQRRLRWGGLWRKQPDHCFESPKVFSEAHTSQIHRWVDKFCAKHPGKVIKIGSAYLRQAKIRTNNQAHYPRSDFDNASAEIFPLLLLNDVVGAQAQGGGIEYAQSCGVSVNVRTEKTGSFSRNRKRGDVGFTEGDPGVIYIIATNYSTIDDYFRNHVSYHTKRQSYPPERNGRLKPLTYEDGRKTHTNSATGLPGAMTYEDGQLTHMNQNGQQILNDISSRPD